MFSKLLFLGLPVVSAEWAWSKGGDMCAGIKIPCDDEESCTAVAYGPCEGNATEPEGYLTGYIMGVALVKDSNQYLSCADPNTCDHMQVLNPNNGGGSGYRDYADYTEYAYTMVGTAIGDGLAISGAYIGTASYLAKSTVSTNMNSVYVAAEDAETPVTREDSKMGAPMGPYDVCISEISGGNCGANRTFTPGTYKFSLFGYTSGQNYQVPAEMTHFGVRTFMSSVNVPISGLQLNDNVGLADIGSTDVTKLTLNLEDGDKIQIDFPLNYNYGSIASRTEDDVLIGDGTKTVKIKVLAAGDTGIYVDYLFDLDDFQASGKYFMYDPDVTVQHEGTAPTPATTPFSGVESLSAGLVPMAIAAVTAVYNI